MREVGDGGGGILNPIQPQGVRNDDLCPEPAVAARRVDIGLPAREELCAAAKGW